MPSLTFIFLRVFKGHFVTRNLSKKVPLGLVKELHTSPHSISVQSETISTSQGSRYSGFCHTMTLFYLIMWIAGNNFTLAILYRERIRFRKILFCRK